MKAKFLFFTCLILGGLSAFMYIASLFLNIIYDKPVNGTWFLGLLLTAMVCLIIITIMNVLKNKNDK
jgi:hypothetical protein